MIKHYKIRVTGKVQGVFFRASTKAKADELGIKGIVQNEQDGSVYIEAEGEEEIMKQFIDWCRRGPSGAVVSSLETQEGEPSKFTSFSIKRF